MYKFRAFALIALLAPTLPAEASTSYIARNGMLVTALDNGDIIVPMRGRANAIDFWCAAGDFVNSRLGVRTTETLYRVSEPPRSSGQPIVFSLSPEGAASSTGVTIFGGPGGGGMKIGAARGFCEASHPLRLRRW